MASPFKKIKLANGATLVTVPMKETKAATLLVFFPVGSRYETPTLAGASHFIEHLMFKGTKRRPDTTHISRELDAIGSEYNAFTGKDHTGYYIKAAAEHLPLALDILSDMLTESLFDNTEMEREKGVVIEEIRMYEDNPLMQIEDELEEILYPKTALGRNIAGTVRTMTEMERVKVLDYHRQFYRPDLMTVVVAGRLPKDALAKVKKTFGAMKRSKNSKPAPFAKVSVTPEMEKAPDLRVKFKETEQVHLAIGFPAYGYGHPKNPALTLLATILGGNMSSRLFIQVRERRGLCYYIRAGLNPYQDIGTFAIQSGLKKDRIEEGVRAILAEVKKIRDHGVEEAELWRAKDYIKGKVVLGLEETSEVADWYGRQQLFLGKMFTPEQKIKRFSAVRAAEIQAVARDIFKKGRLRMAVIGPYKEDATFRKLLDW